MTATAFALVFCAAFLHASWNALVKASGDRGALIALIAAGHVLLGVAIAPFVPLPGREALPWMLASTIIHWLYFYLIFHIYRLADLSLAYPISRGAAPVLVALGAMALIGETLASTAWLGIAAVSLGVVMLAGRDLLRRASATSVLLALVLGVTIASYSVVDGIGVRLSPTSASYVAWLFILEGTIVIWLVARKPAAFLKMGPRAWAIGLAGGLASAIAYGLVLHAKTIAPIGLVSALRETSVVIAAGIGVLLLGERPVMPRIAAATVVAAGIMLIILS